MTEKRFFLPKWPSGMIHLWIWLVLRTTFNALFFLIKLITSFLTNQLKRAGTNLFLVERVEKETESLNVAAGNQLDFDAEQLIKGALPTGISGTHHIAEPAGMSHQTLPQRLSDAVISSRDCFRNRFL